MERLRSQTAIGSINPSGSVDVYKQIDDMLNGISSDISGFASTYNSEIYPVLNGLPKGRSDTRWSSLTDSINPWKNGLDGDNMFVSNSASSTQNNGRYYNVVSVRPRTIRESFEAIYSKLQTDIDGLLEQMNAALPSAGNTLTDAAVSAIGLSVFGSGSSSATSLVGRTTTNLANIRQLAKDLYDDSYDVLQGNGNELLTNYSVRDMMDALLDLHGGAWNSDIDISHSGTALDPSSYKTFTGTTIEETISASEVTVGGFVFDPSLLGVHANHIITFEGLFAYIAAGAAGEGYVKLYDMGAPGSATGVGTLISTLTRDHSDSSITDRENVVLTPSSSPSGSNYIYDSERVYEIRINVDGTGAVTDKVRTHWGGIVVKAS